MFKKVIELSEKRGFLKKIVYHRLKKESLKIGPVGQLLQENLRTEWFNNIVINKDTSVFLSSDDFSETYTFARNICLEEFPFGIAELVKKNKSLLTSETVTENLEEKGKVNKYEFSNFFEYENKIILKCSVFLPPSTSTQYFHQWQKQRRMWWRKISASPGRYSLTDIKTETNNNQSVDIMAKYSWGSQLIETLTLNTNAYRGISAADQLVKDGRKSVPAHNIASTVCLSTMLLNAIADAYEEPKFQDSPRPLFRFHRKLAPYKISFAIRATSTATSTELSELALYLCKLLRSNHISCLFVPSSSKYTLEALWNLHDQTGIPYTILLTESTLKDGVIFLRSRDTTLKEQIHVSELVNYVDLLFKNY